MLRLDMNLVFTIINLLILFLLLKKFLFGPVVSVMEKRKALIEEQLANAANTQEEADKMKAEYEETFKNADSQAADIISEAKKNAKAEYDKIVEDAHTQAGRIVENAEKNMEVQKEKTLRDMESEIAGLAMSAATKVINDKSSGLDNAKLYDEFLGKAGDANDTDIH